MFVLNSLSKAYTHLHSDMKDMLSSVCVIYSLYIYVFVSVFPRQSRTCLPVQFSVSDKYYIYS